MSNNAVSPKATLPPGSYSLANGTMFNLIEPDPALINIDLIAIGLAKTCRYSGQLPGDVFYSVAEHSVLVSRLVPPELALAGLLHDASEGLGMSDVVSPLKKLLPDYKVFEARVMGAVAAAFGLHPDAFEVAEVKQADRALLEAEQIQIRNRPAKRPVDDRYAPPADLEAAGLAFRCALPAEARRMFIERYAEIAGLGA